MKKVLLVVVVMVMGVKGWGQIFPIYGAYCNFDGFLDRLIIYRDTISNPNCRWQIGKPNKTVFTSAYPNNLPNAIVTDTLNPVPANDTSVFYIKFLRTYLVTSMLSFNFMMDGDSNDFGKVEVSPDSGHHWVDILKEQNTYNISWLSNLPYVPGSAPSLNGSSNGWQLYFANMNDWGNSSVGYPVLWNYNIPDTILYRFTYITDSGSTPHDGWMIDNIQVWDYYEGINEACNCVQFELSPNPVNDVLHVSRIPAKNEAIQVMNMMGAVVLEVNNFSGETLDVSRLPKGVYLLRYSCDKGEARERFVKE